MRIGEVVGMIEDLPLVTVFVGGNLVSWRSKKQAVVARSTAEADYRAMVLGLCEMLWLKGLLKELRLRNETTRLHCDNTAAINIANNHVQFDRTNRLSIFRAGPGSGRAQFFFCYFGLKKSRP
jgi:hypothetical protein